MQLAAFLHAGRPSIGQLIGDELVDLTALGAPSHLDALLTQSSDWLGELQRLARAARSRLPVASITHWLPPLAAPGKAVAVGLNYVDHAAESHFKPPEHPVLFTRYPSSWVGHRQPIVRPRVSQALDYEGELVVVIGKGGRHITVADALSHVAGYSVFNEGSVRDVQLRTPQWTLGKNFDRSGAFGPAFVTADELPAGAQGLRLQTRLNGQLMQSADTRDMIFSVAELIARCSEVFAWQPGDILIAGTPAGVGRARTPPVFMRPGDVCEVSIEGIGTLVSPIVDEAVEPGA